MKQTEFSPLNQKQRMEQYYRLHARIYDVTRWSFLFGRQRLISLVAKQTNPRHILEVGCGTGKNLLALRDAFPQAAITGLDISETMLAVAKKKMALANSQVTFVQQAYDRPLRPESPFDLILFSYSLTMMNPGWALAIETAYQDMKPGGRIAVVDFHQSQFASFQNWMGVNHVRMDGHLLPKLDTVCTKRHIETPKAYGGVWQYLLFIGAR